MKKKDAQIKANIGCFAGDLRELLNAAVSQDGASFLMSMKPAKINKNFTKLQVWHILHNGIANYAELEIVEPIIAANILREFAPDEPKAKHEPVNAFVPF